MADLVEYIERVWSQALVAVSQAEEEASKAAHRFAEATGWGQEEVRRQARELAEKLSRQRRELERRLEDGKRAGYDPLLILAIIDVESEFDEEAVSSAGARGLMQIQPTTLYFVAQKAGLKLAREEVASDPALQVRLGIRYLRALNDRFA